MLRQCSEASVKDDTTDQQINSKRYVAYTMRASKQTQYFETSHLILHLLNFSKI